MLYVSTTRSLLLLEFPSKQKHGGKPKKKLINPFDFQGVKIFKIVNWRRFFRGKMESETTDGCGPSKGIVEDPVFEMSVSSSQPATQPLYGGQDSESEEEEEETGEIVSNY